MYHTPEYIVPGARNKIGSSGTRYRRHQCKQYKEARHIPGDNGCTQMGSCITSPHAITPGHLSPTCSERAVAAGKGFAPEIVRCNLEYIFALIDSI